MHTNFIIRFHLSRDEFACFTNCLWWVPIDYLRSASRSSFSTHQSWSAKQPQSYLAEQPFENEWGCLLTAFFDIRLSAENLCIHLFRRKGHQEAMGSLWKLRFTHKASSCPPLNLVLETHFGYNCLFLVFVSVFQLVFVSSWRLISGVTVSFL